VVLRPHGDIESDAALQCAQFTSEVFSARHCRHVNTQRNRTRCKSGGAPKQTILESPLSESAGKKVASVSPILINDNIFFMCHRSGMIILEPMAIALSRNDLRGRTHKGVPSRLMIGVASILLLIDSVQ